MAADKSKRILREELNREMARFLEGGGTINNVPRGLSGREAQTPVSNPFPNERKPEPRTPVTEVIAAVEARRRPPLQRKGIKTRQRGPERRLILDDFGQPLRWEWVDPS